MPTSNPSPPVYAHSLSPDIYSVHSFSFESSDSSQAQELPIPDKYPGPGPLLSAPSRASLTSSQRRRATEASSVNSSLISAPFLARDNSITLEGFKKDGVRRGHSPSPSSGQDWRFRSSSPIAVPMEGMHDTDEKVYEDREELPLLPLRPTKHQSQSSSSPSWVSLQNSSSLSKDFAYSDPFLISKHDSRPDTVLFDPYAELEQETPTPPFTSTQRMNLRSNSTLSSSQSTVFGSPAPASDFLRKAYHKVPDGSPLSTPGSNTDNFKSAYYHPTTRASTYSTTSRISKHPFGPKFRSFEEPKWKAFFWHAAFCVLSYPFLLVFVVISRDRSLFWSRILVGLGCGILGVLLGISLLRLARRIIEAATWATVIHQSRVSEGGGVRLKDLAAQSDDHASALSALTLIWDRYQYPGANRKERKNYDSRPWSIWIIFFLANVGLAGVLPFLFGRLVDIQVHIRHQYTEYLEVSVKGDLSEADLKRAADLRPAFESMSLTWTLAPFSLHGGLPPVVSFPLSTYAGNTSSSEISSHSTSSTSVSVESEADTSRVYFSEVVLSQLLPDGSGFGTFETDTTAPTTNLTAVGGLQTDVSGDDGSGGGPAVALEPGAILRFPRWGIRIKCAKIPDGRTTIVPKSESGLTYVVTPRDTLQELFDAFQMPLPKALQQPLNATALIQGNDTLPRALDVRKMALGAVFYDNGVAHSIKSTPLSMGEEGKGFVTIENILVRLNTTYAPNGTFARLSYDSVPDSDGKATYIGFDAAVCLEIYEPWIVEVYNSSVGVPTSMRIVGTGPSVKDIEWGPNLGKDKRKGKPVDGILTALNSTGFVDVYIAGHQNSVNQILKDNGRDAFYVPSPTLISFTDGQGPFGYTELSETYYAKARALADASNVLPYFSGSGSTLARLYHDREVTSTKLSTLLFIGVMCAVFVMGGISAFFVPRLPLDTPRRGFDLYSWMTAFAAHELVPDRESGLGKQMDLRDIADNAGELRFRYVG